jgi:hypothetical protein
MKISELKSAIREMIISELNEATYAGKDAKADLQKDPKFSSLNAQAKTAALKDLESGGSVTLQEDDALMEMAKIAGDLKVAIEKVIEKNKDGEKKDIRKAIKTDDDVQAALGPDDDLFDNQLNKFIDLVKGEREVGQRGRKASEKPEGETKEKGTRGRPKSATPAVKKKEEKMKTFSMGDKKYYAGGEDEEGPSDLELRKLAKAGGKVEKGKAAQLRAQEKAKLVKAFLKDMRDAGIVDNANRVLDKDKYSTEWSKAKIEIEDKVSKLK